MKEVLTLRVRQGFTNLNRISQLLDLLGNPHERLKVIHVAGSKGKGSTAAIIASVLTPMLGYKTGLYTSPHLITPRERCRIDNKLISEPEVAGYIEKLKPGKLKLFQIPISDAFQFFEIYTALAFTYFADKATDFAVIGSRVRRTLRRNKRHLSSDKQSSHLLV